MIKQAYFRGLTKVAGGYAWYNPATWSTESHDRIAPGRKDPIPGGELPRRPVINPVGGAGRSIADAIGGKTPADTPQQPTQPQQAFLQKWYPRSRFQQQQQQQQRQQQPKWYPRSRFQQQQQQRQQQQIPQHLRPLLNPLPGYQRKPMPVYRGPLPTLRQGPAPWPQRKQPSPLQKYRQPLY